MGTDLNYIELKVKLSFGWSTTREKRRDIDAFLNPKEVSGKLHASKVLHLGKGRVVPTGKDVRWNAEPVMTGADFIHDECEKSLTFAHSIK
jgi:hypothetical protein